MSLEARNTSEQPVPQDEGSSSVDGDIVVWPDTGENALLADIERKVRTVPGTGLWKVITGQLQDQS